MIDLSELFKLSVDERIKLAQDLWDNVANEPENLPPLSEELCAELDRRMNEHECDPGSAIPWEVVRENLWRLLKNSEI